MFRSSSELKLFYEQIQMIIKCLKLLNQRAGVLPKYCKIFSIYIQRIFKIFYSPLKKGKCMYHRMGWRLAYFCCSTDMIVADWPGTGTCCDVTSVYISVGIPATVSIIDECAGYSLPPTLYNISCRSFARGVRHISTSDRSRNCTTGGDENDTSGAEVVRRVCRTSAAIV